jgi:hypothetical protein
VQYFTLQVTKGAPKLPMYTQCHLPIVSLLIPGWIRYRWMLSTTLFSTSLARKPTLSTARSALHLMRTPWSSRPCLILRLLHHFRGRSSKKSNASEIRAGLTHFILRFANADRQPSGGHKLCSSAQLGTETAAAQHWHYCRVSSNIDSKHCTRCIVL